MEYWFHDEETGNAVEWPVNYDNPLRSMVEHIYRSQDRVRLHAHYLYGHDTHNDFYFWKVTKPELRIG
jgi:hypothetical protein